MTSSSNRPLAWVVAAVALLVAAPVTRAATSEPSAAAEPGAMAAGVADVASQPAAEAQPADAVADQGDRTYRVGVNDALRIEVYDEPRLTGEFTVDSDGRVSFPLLGPVKVAALTAREVSAELTRLLERDFLNNPQVAVTVTQFRSQKVELLGAVNRPGTYFLDRDVRLLDLLARAEGMTRQQGDARRGQEVRIVRQAEAGGEPEKLMIDLHDLLVVGNAETNILLRSGDVVYVPESVKVFVIGEVKQPGDYPFEAGMTVLKAVTMAGGPNSKASLKGAMIRRIDNGHEVKIKARLEDLLLADDIVEVEASFW